MVVIETSNSTTNGVSHQIIARCIFILEKVTKLRGLSLNLINVINAQSRLLTLVLEHLPLSRSEQRVQLSRGPSRLEKGKKRNIKTLSVVTILQFSLGIIIKKKIYHRKAFIWGGGGGSHYNI